jgi:hypothetical protein
MTPAQQEAKELIELFFQHMDLPIAKKCALIAVEKIIEAIDFDWMEVQNLESQHRYWNKVQEEIDKL